MKKTIAFIGIDPSINSTGVTVRLVEYDNDVPREQAIRFYILKPDTHEVTKTGKIKSPLTNNEKEAQKNIPELEYVLYNKIILDKNTQDTSLIEKFKTFNLIEIANTILHIIELYKVDEYYICIEGISYGSSIRTVSVFDLAGLNYLIRSTIFNKEYKHLYIIPPTGVKKFATGKGNAKKEVVVSMFEQLFSHLNIPKVDDIADAFFMSRMAQRLYEQEHFI